MKKALFIVISTILVITGISCQNQKSLPKNTVAEKATGRIIDSVTFSDGRHMLLLQAISASGARYANTDESFVFWNKGNTTFIEESHKPEKSS